MRLFVQILLTSALIAICSHVVHADDEKPEAGRPVILLTGFEPFGALRPPNPSWEGIRDLHDTEWQGYHIICHELPVVWGAPLQQVSALLQKHDPVAVFSFGQGRPDAFAIETRALNLRGRFPDNSGGFPPEKLITPNGPAEYDATIDSHALQQRLSQKGYSVRVSRDAGQYLCEETLYSLEFLRKQHPGLTVAFCHVPPLGSRTGDQTVSVEYVKQFVVDYLEAWESTAVRAKAADIRAAEDNGVDDRDEAIPGALMPTSTAFSQNSDASKATPEATHAAASPNPELPAVEKLIAHYFQSWSDQKMADYGACFVDNAVIQQITDRGEIYSQAKVPFVEEQALYHRTAKQKAVEIPVTTEIRFEAELARAVVYWKLTAGSRTQFGYDHFTLLKQGNEWKIVNLVFYATTDRDPK